MVKKIIVWQKVQKYVYKEKEYNDDSMPTLSIFLNDGLGYKSYIDFLEDTSRVKFTGNISYMKKQGKMVTIEVEEYVYPEMPLFTTTIDNLITIINEVERLEELEVDRIEISLENEVLTISGD